MGNEIIIATGEVKLEFHFFWKEECLCIVMNKCTHAYTHTQKWMPYFYLFILINKIETQLTNEI